jgi:peptidoglycan hydrolase-like protein with peptidoglycan-binding domain
MGVAAGVKESERGEVGEKVKEIQEWLCLNGFAVVIDSIFGPATEEAVRQFQRSQKLDSDGRVSGLVYCRLVEPMTRALVPLLPTSDSLAAMVHAFAEQHVRSHPREIGGENRGPWVRLYVDGREGTAWPWCAGFVSFVLRQACASLLIPMPIPPTLSCDQLAIQARKKGLFRSEQEIRSNRHELKPGSIFLVRKNESDWTHAGIVVKCEKEHFVSIEGNTNEQGEREGFELCRRIRGYAGKDFIIFT